VINVRPTRVLLVTDRHVAYLRARHLRRHSIYKAKWLIPIAEMQNLTGRNHPGMHGHTLAATLLAACRSLESLLD
jgi:hypothetical protein